LNFFKLLHLKKDYTFSQLHNRKSTKLATSQHRSDLAPIDANGKLDRIHRLMIGLLAENQTPPVKMCTSFSPLFSHFLTFSWVMTWKKKPIKTFADLLLHHRDYILDWKINLKKPMKIWTFLNFCTWKRLHFFTTSQPYIYNTCYQPTPVRSDADRC
jgi:hypothetical protein